MKNILNILNNNIFFPPILQFLWFIRASFVISLILKTNNFKVTARFNEFIEFFMDILTISRHTSYNKWNNLRLTEIEIQFLSIFIFDCYFSVKFIQTWFFTCIFLMSFFLFHFFTFEFFFGWIFLNLNSLAVSHFNCKFNEHLNHISSASNFFAPFHNFFSPSLLLFLFRWMKYAWISINSLVWIKLRTAQNFFKYLKYVRASFDRCEKSYRTDWNRFFENETM